MSESNYPNKIDSNKELPLAQNGLTIIDANFVNSLRSAIIQIEKTLGINPQGQVGFTVAQRLQACIDSAGKLKKEALAEAGAIFSDITNENISDNAGIKESKLSLAVPTSILNSQLSINTQKIDLLYKTITELEAILSAHTNKNSTGRHGAKSINVSSYSGTSDSALKQLSDETLEDFLKKIISSHLLFSGANISEENSSHSAKQIWVDNSNIDFTESDLQSVLEVIYSSKYDDLYTFLSNICSNGIPRNSVSNKNFNYIFQDKAFEFSNSSSSTTLLIATEDILPLNLEQWDIVSVSGTTYDDGAYKIKNINLSSGNIASIEIFAKLKQAGTINCSAYKSNFIETNTNSFNSTVRPSRRTSDTPDIVICDPTSATIHSSGFNPSKINSSASSFKIIVDGTETTISAYDPLYEKTIDSIVYRINKQLVEYKVPVMCFKNKTKYGEEISISHMIPFIDGENRTLKITQADENDATTELGFSSVLDTFFVSEYGSSVIVGGSIKKDFSSYKIFTKGDISPVIGTAKLSTTTNLLAEGVSVGDTIIIETNNSDDSGAFRIKYLDENSITLGYFGFSFTEDFSDNCKIYIIKNSISVSEYNFEEVDSISGLLLLNVFWDGKSFFSSKRAEISGMIDSSRIFLTVTDISKSYAEDEEITLTLTTSGTCYLTNSHLVSGSAITVHSTGYYNIPSPDGKSWVTIWVQYTALPLSQSTITIYGKKDLSPHVFNICTALFGNDTGRVLGTTGSIGIPSITDKRFFGNIGLAQIAPDFIESYIEGPRGELTKDGVIIGCEITGISTSTDSEGDYVLFTVNKGVVIVSGIRWTISKMQIKNYTSNNFYIAIDLKGNIVCRDALTSAKSPFVNQRCATLAFIKIAETSVVTTLSEQTYFDIREFITFHDNKISKEIIVGKSINDSHFTDIKKAIQYVSLFSKIKSQTNDYCPTIYIREGEYEIEEPILIDFDVIIKGSGPNTILKRSALLNGVEYNSSLNFDLSKSLFIIGGGYNSNSNSISKGITIRDISYSTYSSFSGIASVFSITQTLSSSRANPYFCFENIHFSGPSTMNAGSNAVFDVPILLTREESRSLPTGLRMGNIVVRSCYFNYCGMENGIIVPYLDPASDANCRIKNILYMGNISQNTNPDSIRTTSFVYTDYGLGVIFDEINGAANAIED